MDSIFEIHEDILNYLITNPNNTITFICLTF